MSRRCTPSTGPGSIPGRSPCCSPRAATRDRGLRLARGELGPPAPGAGALEALLEPGFRRGGARARGVDHPGMDGALEIHFGDNVEVLPRLASGAFDLIYIDPPFNTGKPQSAHAAAHRARRRHGDRTGFGGQRYRTDAPRQRARSPTASTTTSAFLEPRLARGAPRCSSPTGSFFFHLDYREVHYCKVLLDQIFGRARFLNEIIWAYDYGARTTKRWSPKHDNILWYAQGPGRLHLQRYDEIDRIPYMAPALVGAGEGRARQDAHRHLVAHDRQPDRQGEDRLPDAEAARRSSSASCACTRTPATWCSTSSPAAARSARPPRSTAAAPCWSTRAQEALRVMQRRLAFAQPTFHGYPVRRGRRAKPARARQARQERCPIFPLW